MTLATGYQQFAAGDDQQFGPFVFYVITLNAPTPTACKIPAGITVDTNGDPVDFATAALQTALSTQVGEVQASPTANTVLGRLKDIDDEITSLNAKVTAANTGAVVVSSSALPAGAATSAKQDTQITHAANAAQSLVEVEGVIYEYGFMFNPLTDKLFLVGGWNTGSGQVVPFNVDDNNRVYVNLQNSNGDLEYGSGAAGNGTLRTISATNDPVASTVGTYGSATIPTTAVMMGAWDDVNAHVGRLTVTDEMRLKSSSRLVNDSELPANYGSGASSSQTLRTVLSSDSSVSSVNTLYGGGTLVGSDSPLFPHAIAGYGSTAVPTAVTGDGKLTNFWLTRNGALNCHPVRSNGSDYDSSNPLSVRVESQGNTLTVSPSASSPGFIADDAAFTPGTTIVRMAGFQADETSTDSVDEGDGGAARMTLDRKQIVTIQPHTQGGLSIMRSLDIDETEEDVKTSRGQLYSVFACNTATSTRYLKFYNATAANVTVGTTTPVLTIPIPGNASDDIAAVINFGSHGVEFDTAISVACTTGLADNDTGAPAANDVIINVFYK